MDVKDERKVRFISGRPLAVEVDVNLALASGWLILNVAFGGADEPWIVVQMVHENSVRKIALPGVPGGPNGPRF